MNIYVPNLRLPSEYQEVEYIESSGTQYINPNYVANINSEFSLRVSWGTQSGSWRCFFGSCSSDNKAYGVQVRIYSDTSTNLTAWFCGPGDDDTLITGLTLNQFYDISLNKNSFKVGNITKTYSVSGTFPSSGINIFRNSFSVGSDGYRNSSIKLAYFQISEGGILIRDFVPCYRKSDGEIGLYDLVNSVFYTNSGTGTFSKGNDVTMAELKNAYIGEYKGFEYSYDFTTGSVTDLQNKGWTVPSGSIVNSSGYYNSNKNRGRLKISLPQLGTAAQTAIKVTYWLSWTASGYQQRLFSLVNGSTEICTLYGDGSSQTGGNSAMFGNQSLVSEDGYSYGRNGTFTTTVTVDLVNKTRKYEGTNHTTLTGTVTDTAITNFRTVNGLQVYGEQTAYITSIGVKVE